MMRCLNGLHVRSRRILGLIFILTIILIIKLALLISIPGTATYCGYYEPLTINFNTHNTFSLFHFPLRNSLENISFPSYIVKSLYPQAKVKLSKDGEEMLGYVWKLKLDRRPSRTYTNSIENIERLNKFYTNYPLPDQLKFYDIPGCSNLILGLGNGRYAYLIQIKTVNAFEDQADMQVEQQRRLY